MQAYFLFWVAYNLMQDERTAKGALLAFAAAGSLLVVLVRAGLIEWGDEASRAEGRLTVLGQDPNVFAGNLMLTIVILLGLSYGLGRGTFRYPFLIWPLVALVGATATYTGSRGGFVALFAGLLVFAFRGGGAASVLRTVLITLVACGLCVAISLRTGSMWSRYARTLDEGNMSGRERIYPEAWGMVLESPVVGFGPTDCLYELGKRTGEDRLFRDPHNLVLELLISVGIVGAIPVFTCLALSGSAAWKARPGAAGVVPFALFATVLVLSMSISWLASKTAWLVMAYANAAAAATRPGTPTHRRLPPCAG